jgi:hypothetical protein
MIEQTTEFLEPKHKSLRLISKGANILAWVALVLFTFQALNQILGYFDLMDSQTLVITSPNNQTSIFTNILNFANIGMKGLVYWFLLEGTALGLDMIVETDINYREKRKGEKNEQ